MEMLAQDSQVKYLLLFELNISVLCSICSLFEMHSCLCVCVCVFESIHLCLFRCQYHLSISVIIFGYLIEHKNNLFSLAVGCSYFLWMQLTPFPSTGLSTTIHTVCIHRHLNLNKMKIQNSAITTMNYYALFILCIFNIDKRTAKLLAVADNA